jgi:hypothetical protein
VSEKEANERPHCRGARETWRPSQGETTESNDEEATARFSRQGCSGAMGEEERRRLSPSLGKPIPSPLRQLARTIIWKEIVLKDEYGALVFSSLFSCKLVIPLLWSKGSPEDPAVGRVLYPLPNTTCSDEGSFRMTKFDRSLVIRFRRTVNCASKARRARLLPR